MSGDLLQTKLYVPVIRPNLVPRPHLIDRLNHGLHSGHKLTLLSAPAGFGKTTLIKHCAKIVGDRAGGFSTEEISGEGVRGRKGFRLITLEGKEGVFAKVDDETPFKLGRYGVHLEVLEDIGVKAIEMAIEEKEWILVDEIGKMEEGSKEFRDVMLKAME